MRFLPFALLILLINFIIFKPLFTLDFWGDDWLIFWVNKYFHGPPSSGEWNWLNHFFTLYGSQALLMETLKFIFGMNAFYFYLASFIFRLMTAYSLYPLVSYLTKSKLAAYFSCLFFSITFTGLETSEYLPHMTSYIALTFLNLFLYFFIRSREEKNTKFLFLSGVLFFLAFMSSPIRIVGLIPLVLLLEITNILRHNRSLRTSLIRTSIIIVIFLLVNIFGHPFLSVTEPQHKSKSQTLPLSQLSSGINTFLTEVEEDRYMVLFSPFVSFGNAFIPDVSLPKLEIFQTLTISYILFVILSFVLTFSISNLSPRFRTYLNLSGLIWTFFIALIYSFNLNTNLHIVYVFPLLISGYILILGIFLMIKFSHRRLIFDSLLISLAWPFLSFAIAWIYSPIGFIPSSQRYLIGANVGVALFMATVIALAKNKKILTVLFLLIFLTHFIHTQKYWPSIEKNRNRYLGTKIWSTIPYYPEVGKNKDPDIFYFQGDGYNSSVIGDLITFGFPPHIDLVYNLNYLKGDKIPVPMSQWEDVVEAVKSGRSLGAYSYPLRPVPIDQIYAFSLTSDNNLINITNETREKLKKEI